MIDDRAIVVAEAQIKHLALKIEGIDSPPPTATGFPQLIFIRLSNITRQLFFSFAEISTVRRLL